MTVMLFVIPAAGLLPSSSGCFIVFADKYWNNAARIGISQ